MIMKKVFGFIGLALALAACNNLESVNKFDQTADGITITATLAPKSTFTKAISDQSTYLKVDWAVDEHLAILYTKDGNQMADATITAVDGTGAATITFSVVDGTPDNTACTIIYPKSAAKDDHSGVKPAGVLLASQDGTLNANLDVRVGAGTIQTATPSLTVTTQPEPQFAIFKFTTKNEAGSATISVKPLAISIGTLDYIVTPSTATSELYVALPAVSSKTVSFSAINSSDSKMYTCSKSVTFSAGNYYQSTLKMAQSTKTFLIVSKGTTNLSGDKLFYYTPGETYQQAVDNNPENKVDSYGWNTWSNHYDQATIYFKENEGSGIIQKDMSRNGVRNAYSGDFALGSTVKADGTYVFMDTY